MDYIVKTEGLCKDFGSFRLEDVNLELPGGTIMGLIGENVPRYEQKTLSIT